MATLRRYAYATFFVACAHLIFGAIVRISGSGMGCGDHWPKCYGSFFPPLDRPDLIIEVSHRYLASILLLSLIVLLGAAWRRRGEPGVSGRGGVLRGAALGVALGVSAALLGAVTVKLGNAPFATLAHWTVAMSLVATVVGTLIRAGGLGGASIRGTLVTPKTQRGAFAAAAVALVTVVMGGLTAKYPGAAVACQAFPLCGTNPDVAAAAVYVQVVHRILAVLLVLHLIGLAMAIRGRRESSLIVRVAFIAMGFGVLQILVAGAMIGMHLPPVLRSLHEATGVSVWIATFVLAYLARIAGDGRGVREPRIAPSPDDLADAGEIRVPAMASKAYSTAIAEPPRRSRAEPRESWQGEAESAGRVVAAASSWPIAPADVLVAPEDLHIAPSDVPVAPVNLRIAQADLCIAPADLVVAAADLLIAPADVIVAPADLIVTPADVIVAPGEETLVTTADSVSRSASDDLTAVALHEDDDVPHYILADEAPEIVIAEMPSVVVSEVREVRVPAVAPAITSTPQKTTRGSTMRHSIAVIVARGADL